VEPYIGEIRLFAGNFAPRGWALCLGQLLSISQYTQLFSILGTNYGGNGKTTFALPDLRGRAPMHQGQGAGLTYRQLGEQGGEQSVVLIELEMPAHSHTAAYQAAPAIKNPAEAVWTSTGRRGTQVYGPNANVTMHVQSIGIAGGGFPHNNMQPYLGLNFIIALEGEFPSRS